MYSTAIRPNNDDDDHNNNNNNNDNNNDNILYIATWLEGT